MIQKQVPKAVLTPAVFRIYTVQLNIKKYNNSNHMF